MRFVFNLIGITEIAGSQIFRCLVVPASFNSQIVISKTKCIDLFFVTYIFYRIQGVSFVAILFKDRVEFKFFI